MTKFDLEIPSGRAVSRRARRVRWPIALAGAVGLTLTAMAAEPGEAVAMPRVALAAGAVVEPMQVRQVMIFGKKKRKSYVAARPGGGITGDGDGPPPAPMPRRR